MLAPLCQLFGVAYTASPAGYMPASQGIEQFTKDGSHYGFCHAGRVDRQYPLLALRRISPHPGVTLLVKLEGNNPAGSVKDRPALNLIKCAEASGHLAPGARLIEATSGNTGIALAMVAAARGYRMRLIMPNTMSQERRDAMQAYGAELVLVEGGMEAARDLALAMQARGEGLVLDQFNNPANPDAHYLSTGPGSGARARGGPHSSRPWAPRAPSWGLPLPQGAEPGGAGDRSATGRGSQIPGSAAGLRPTCPPFSSLLGSIGCWT